MIQIYYDYIQLSQIRRQKYHNVVASSRSKIHPAMLPPSPRAAYHYRLTRVFHQVLVWRRLSQKDIQPLNWG